MGAKRDKGAKNKGDFSVSSMTKDRLPRLPFVNIKNEVLGPLYDLSLVFTGNSLSQKLNRTYRGKNKPTNVLSFPLDKNSGEIFIDIRKTKSEAKELRRNFKNYVGFLFIHGLLHLKGLEHGSTMSKEEDKIMAIFGIRSRT